MVTGRTGFENPQVQAKNYDFLREVPQGFEGKETRHEVAIKNR